MQETEDLSDGDEDGEESTKRRRVFSGDDLGDSFSVDEEQPKKGWINEVFERKDDGSSEDSESEGGEDDGESDGGHPLKDWEQSDNELETELEDDDDDDDDNEDDEEVEPRVHKKSKNDYASLNKGEGLSGTVKQKTIVKKLSSTQHDIPFLINAPETFEELIALVEDCSNAEVIVIIDRIRKRYSIKLAAGNRKKMQVIFIFALKDNIIHLLVCSFFRLSFRPLNKFMPHLLSECLLLSATQVFYGILLQYFAVLTNKKPLNFELLNMLVKPLVEMSMEIPYFAAICARQRLLKTRAQFCEAIKNPGL